MDLETVTRTHSIAGVSVPDNPLITAVIAYARRLSEPYLFNRLVTARPETSYDNFLRDFGERFVPGYQAVSTSTS